MLPSKHSVLEVFKIKKNWLLCFRLQDYHLLWQTFPGLSANKTICNQFYHNYDHNNDKKSSLSVIVIVNFPVLQPLPKFSCENFDRFGLLPFHSPLLGEFCEAKFQLSQKSLRDCFLFLRLLRCFTSAG